LFAYLLPFHGENETAANATKEAGMMPRVHRNVSSNIICSQIVVNAGKTEREREKRNKQAFHEYADRRLKEKKLKLAVNG
jgi:hypothetical protein